MIFYEKTLIFRRGVMLQINPTYACNFHCSYCSVDMVKGFRPNTKPISMEQWKEKIKTFPVKIREIFISGGEPTLVKWMPEFVNWLLGEGYHVTVFSNLFNAEEFLKVRKSYRFQIRTTYHHIGEESLERFEKQYAKVKDYHYVSLCEIGHRTLSYTDVVNEYFTMDDLKTSEFRYAPDGRLYTSHYELSQNQ